MFSYRDKDRRVQGLLREKFAKQLLYQRDTNRLQQNTRQLQTNAQNQVNRMLVIIARKQTRIGKLIREKFVIILPRIMNPAGITADPIISCAYDCI